jgi:hypothetical protein
MARNVPVPCCLYVLVSAFISPLRTFLQGAKAWFHKPPLRGEWGSSESSADV